MIDKIKSWFASDNIRIRQVIEEAKVARRESLRNIFDTFKESNLKFDECDLNNLSFEEFELWYQEHYHPIIKK